jgi:predicted lactoylglutathione lyase
MTNDIWLNLPVKDLAKSIHFFTQIGFSHNPGPGNTANSASFLIGDKKIVLMLFAQAMFTGFTRHALADTSQGSEVLFSLGAVTREDVDNYALSAKAAGGTVFAEPGESNGFMYGCGFCDPDGHRWNALFMDMSKLPKS